MVAINGIDKAFTSTQSYYVIKSRQISDLPEALTLLRRFIPGEPSSLQRCEKYAVLLHMVTSSVVDQFAIAELGLATKETVRQKLKTIDVETLRQLYIDGINKFLESSLDSAVIELVDCLTRKFRNIDAKARSFLNNKELQETMSQYKSILNMPLNFLLDPNVQHPSITSEQLKPSVKQALIRIFNGQTAMIDRKFPSTLDSGTSSSFVQDTSGVNSSRSASSDQRAQTVVSEADLIPQSTTRQESSQPLEGPEQQITLSDDEHEYLSKLLAALIRLQQELVASSKIDDRCQAYGKVIQSNEDTLNDKLVDDIIGEVSKDAQNVEKKDEKPYIPEKTLRDHFLFVVSTFGPPELGDAWLDLFYCTTQWEEIDPEAREFVRSPHIIKEIDEIMSNAEKAALEAQKLDTDNSGDKPVDKHPSTESNDSPKH